MNGDRPAPGTDVSPDPVRVDFLATWPHYIDHMAPVWAAIPVKHRGDFLVPFDLHDHANRRGVDTPTPIEQSVSDRPVVIASRGNLAHVPNRPRPLISMPHGVTQTYGGVSLLPHLDEWAGIICSPHAVPVYEACHPGVPVAGIAPAKLDVVATLPARKRSRPATVAISWHWPSVTNTETASGWEWSRAAVEDLVASKRYRILGHKHPADRRPIGEWWASIGVEYVPDFADVIGRADCYVVDNSSTLYEFAATDRPVVVLNPPSYDRHADHGLRFWDHAGVGPQVTHPSQIPAAIAEALADVPARRDLRRAAVAAAYGPLDGRNAERAAAAIVQFAADARDRPPVLIEDWVHTSGRRRRITASDPRYQAVASDSRWRRVGPLDDPYRRALLAELALVEAAGLAERVAAVRQELTRLDQGAT